MKLALLCLVALSCAGCYIPDLSDPGGAQRTRRTRQYIEDETRRIEDNWYRQDRLDLEKQRLELERQRVQGW